MPAPTVCYGACTHSISVSLSTEYCVVPAPAVLRGVNIKTQVYNRFKTCKPAFLKKLEIVIMLLNLP